MSPELLTIATALGLYAAVVVSPGPNFALISRLAISGARPTAVGATFGLAIAATIYAVAWILPALGSRGFIDRRGRHR